MMSDLPHTLFKDRNKQKQSDIDDALRKTIEANKKKMAKRNGSVKSVEELFDNE